PTTAIAAARTRSGRVSPRASWTRSGRWAAGMAARLPVVWPEPEGDLWLELLAALRLERIRQGLTIAELGERIGLTGGHIEKLENGVKRPGGFLLASWAWALGFRLSLSPLGDDPYGRPCPVRTRTLRRHSSLVRLGGVLSSD